MKTPVFKNPFWIALFSYSLWGFFPIYWKQLSHVHVAEVLSHRIIWSAVFYFLLLRARGPHAVESLFSAGRRQWFYSLSAGTLLGLNWGIYIFAINTGRILEGSLAYFITPFVSFIAGAALFGERLSRPLKIAILIAGFGVLLKIVDVGLGTWISLILAASFGGYGAFKKLLTVNPRAGSVMEGLALFLPALVGAVYFRTTSSTSLVAADWILLLLSGVVTGLPLYLFSVAAQKVDMSFLGMAQFLSPTLQFFVGVFLYGERVSAMAWSSFALIWIGIAVYTASEIRK